MCECVFIGVAGRSEVENRWGSTEKRGVGVVLYSGQEIGLSVMRLPKIKKIKT